MIFEHFIITFEMDKKIKKALRKSAKELAKKKKIKKWYEEIDVEDALMNIIEKYIKK